MPRSAGAVRRIAAATAALVAALCTLPFAGAPAVAADATFTVAVISPTTTVQTGVPIDVEIAYSCVGAVACTGIVVDIPRPQGLFDGFTYTSGRPVPTTSADVASVAVGDDKSVRFTFADPVPAGRTGTVGVHYPTDNGPIANGTPFVVTATATGGNVDPASGSVSVTQTATPAAIQSYFYAVSYPAYLDRDVRFIGRVGATIYGTTGQEGIGSVPATVTLPAGSVYVTATPAPTSISPDGLTLTWDNLPGNDVSPYEGSNIDVTVRFPTPTFTSGQSVPVGFAAQPVSVGGTPMTPVNITANTALQQFVEVFNPALQLLPSNYISATTVSSAIVARGAQIGVGFYLNNYPSNVEATSATMSADLPTQFTVLGVNKPYDDSVLTIRWTTASGATGSFSTADYPEDVDPGGFPTLASLGVPAGDPIAHLDIDAPTIPGPGGASYLVSGTLDAPNRAVVRIDGSVTYRAQNFPDALRTADVALTVVDPVPIPTISMSADTSNTVRPGDALDWQLFVYQQQSGDLPLEPVVFVPVPAGTVLAADPVTVGSEFNPAPAGFESPITRVVHSDALGLDVLQIRWPGSPVLPPTASLNLAVHTVVTTAPAGSLVAFAYAGDARGPIDEYPFVNANPPTVGDSISPPYAGRVIDDRDVDGDGTPGGMLARASADALVGSGVGVASQLEVRGSLDPAFVTAPQIAATAIGEPITYRLPIENTGNVALGDMVVYDILPFVGDTGVSQAGAAIPRGSQFTPTLDGPVPAPSGFSVAYSTSTNPCRPEVYPGLVGCVDDWTDAPADYAAVRSLRFTQESGSLDPGDVSSSTWSMVVPTATPGGQVAVNSVAFAAVRADTGASVTGEPAFVTIQVAEADLAVTLAGGQLVAGTPTALDLHAINHGPSGAPGVRVEVALPDGVTAEVPAAAAAAAVGAGADPSGADAGAASPAADESAAVEPAAATWTCAVDGPTVTCAATGTMDVGEGDVLPVTVTADPELVDSTVEVTAAITGDFPDPVTGNDEVTAALDVVGAPPPPSPSATPTPTDGSTASPSGVPTLDAGATGSATGRGWSNLARTGASVAGLVVLAGVLVGAGIVLRRRRGAAGS